MAEAFRKALDYLKNEAENPAKRAMLQLRFPEFRDRGYVVNFFVDSDPPLLGMRFDEPRLQLTPKLLRHVTRIGLLHGFTVHRVGEEIYYLRDGKVMAMLSKQAYATADPKLFEEVGREVYGVGGEKRIEDDKPVGWLKALKLIFSRS